MLIGPGIILILVGLVVVWVAVRGWQERLPRNYIAGVRTPSTMRSDEAFRLANKKAAPLLGAGGVFLAGGGLAAALVSRSGAWIPIVGGVAVFLVPAMVGGARGIRAAREIGRTGA